MSSLNRLKELIETGALDTLGLSRLDESSMDLDDTVNLLSSAMLNLHVLFEHEVKRSDALEVRVDILLKENRKLEMYNLRLGIKGCESDALSKEIEELSAQLQRAYAQITDMGGVPTRQQGNPISQGSAPQTPPDEPLTDVRVRESDQKSEDRFAMKQLTSAIEVIEEDVSYLSRPAKRRRE